MFLGIDTSNYTTSIAVVSEEKQLLFDQRQVLKVEFGERGLKQSEALFQHVQNLPLLLDEALVKFQGSFKGVCYSQKPRPIEGSYMPVFRVGEGAARILAPALGVPLYISTHQEGHLAAGLWSARFKPTGSFLAMHLSGGTTDLLLVQPHLGGFQIDLLGSSSDLHAGQFVDRVGVKLGLSFPAGPALEKLAQNSSKYLKVSLPSSVDEFSVSFSGPCSAAMRQVESGALPEEIAFAVFRCIANSVEKVLLLAIRKTGLREILFVGGVASNRFIKERLKQRLEHPAVDVNLYFAKSEYSRDNAVGVGLLGISKWMDQE